MTDEPRRRPRAVRLEPLPGFQDESDRPVRAAPPVEILPDPAAFAGLELEPEERAVEVAQQRGIFRRTLVSWGGLFWSALTGLVSLAASLWAWNTIESLFARSKVLGDVGLGLLGVAILALLVMGTRELMAIGRQRHIARLHQDFAKAHAADDQKLARKLVADLASLYGARPETAQARQDVLALTKEIVDGRDLVEIAERTLVGPLDARANAAIAIAAKRVSVVTTIAPRAIIDVAFVLLQAVRLIRRIAEIYGGSAGVSRLPQAGALGRRASGDHRRHGGGRQPAAAGRRAWFGGKSLGAARRGRPERAADGADRRFGHVCLPADAVRGAEDAEPAESGALPVQVRRGRETGPVKRPVGDPRGSIV